jgi:hypothetical protein
MPRKANPDLTVDWKIPLPATLAGTVEFLLLDPVTNKPRYGERSRLVAALLADWCAEQGRKLTIDSPPSADIYKRKYANG